MELSNERRFAEDARGPLYVWDIDGTYLETDLSSAAGMLAIPFEFAIDKVSVPGAVPLLQGLRHGVGARSQLVPLYFVSASPPQMRRVIERKMTIDGVEYDGIAFKDQLRMVFSRRVRQLTHQVGYKMAALIRYRTLLPAATQWTLFGDDLESDGDIFALFSEACGGLRGGPLRRALEVLGTHGLAAEYVTRLADGLPPGDPVEAVHIRQARRAGARSWLAPARELPSMGGRLTAAHTYLQHALLLHARGRISTDFVKRVARDVLASDPRLRLSELLREAQEIFEIAPDLMAALRATFVG
jgi:hypothetical protein